MNAYNYELPFADVLVRIGTRNKTSNLCKTEHVSYYVYFFKSTIKNKGLSTQGQKSPQERKKITHLSQMVFPIPIN